MHYKRWTSKNCYIGLTNSTLSSQFLCNCMIAVDEQVYVPRLDDPSARTFERCSTDTFKMQGPCGYGICYLYLRREGYDGWMPDSVKVFDNNYGKSVTFPFRTPLPNAVWYGFNNCHRIVAGAATNAAEIAGKGLVSES